MRIAGKIMIGLGLLLFGIVDWQIPVSLFVGGACAISLDNEIKF